jgi:hypothetical protein
VIDPVSIEAARVVRDITGDDSAEVLAPLKRRKSQVFLVGRGGHRPPVVAKLADGVTIDNEARVLELLGSAPMRSLHLHGVAESSQTGSRWLVAEFAAGDSYDPDSARHRRVAGRWMAGLHEWSEEVGPLPLPDRGVSYHHAVTSEAVATLDAAETALQRSAADLRPLRSLRAVAATLLERWSEVEQILGALPPVLVHSGFAGKNVVIGEDAGDPVVLAFDWEQGGWGSGAADLSMVDVEAYLQVRGHRVGPAPATVHRSALIGRVLWCLAPVPMERSNLLGRWPEKALRKLPAYLSWSREALDELNGRQGRVTP